MGREGCFQFRGGGWGNEERIREGVGCVEGGWLFFFLLFNILNGILTNSVKWYQSLTNVFLCGSKIKIKNLSGSKNEIRVLLWYPKSKFP